LKRVCVDKKFVEEVLISK